MGTIGLVGHMKRLVFVFIVLLTGKAFFFTSRWSVQDISAALRLYNVIELYSATTADNLTQDESANPHRDPDAFPRWGDPGGIALDAILEYLDFASHPSRIDDGRDLLDLGNFPIPNVAYIFGAQGSAFSKSYSTTTIMHHDNPSFLPPSSSPAESSHLWTERRRHQRLYGWLKRDRYLDVERLLRDSLGYLLNNNKGDDHDGSGTSGPQSHIIGTTSSRQWPKLYEIVVANRSAGIPMILKLDDNRLCSKGNLPHWKNTTTTTTNNNTAWSVPIWRLAAAHHATDCNYEFPLPTYTFLRYIREQESDMTRNFNKSRTEYPWHSKRRAVVWRGSPSAYRADISKLPRNIMIARANDPAEEKIQRQLDMDSMAKRRNNTTTSSSSSSNTVTDKGDEMNNNNNGTILDVKIRGAPKAGDRNAQKLLELGAKFGPGIPFDDFQQYVGVLDADGNSWSERFGRLLCLNSVVLKVDPEFVDFFMPTLRPWVHYVPVKADSSDIWNITRWVVDPMNEIRVRQIIRNANEWCERTMSYKRTMEYVLTALEFYIEQLYRDDPEWPQRWADALAYSIPPSNHDWTIL